MVLMIMPTPSQEFSVGFLLFKSLSFLQWKKLRFFLVSKCIVFESEGTEMMKNVTTQHRSWREWKEDTDFGDYKFDGMQECGCSVWPNISKPLSFFFHKEL